MKNDVHIVFKVMNFVYSDEFPKISPASIVVLLLLARYQGPLGICPSISSIAKKVKFSERYITKLIKELESKGIILIEKKPGKVNYFRINLSTAPEQQFTPYPRTTVHHTPEQQFTTPLNNSSLNITKLNNLTISRATTSADASSLLAAFKPDAENQKLSKSYELNIDDEIKSFKEKYSGNARNLQSAFSKWLEQARVYHQKKRFDTLERNEKSSTYKDMTGYNSGEANKSEYAKNMIKQLKKKMIVSKSLAN